MVVQKIIQEHTRLLKISGNESCENLLTELADYVIHENLAKQGFTKALLERERNFPTGIQAQTGIAIPHSEQEYTLKPSLIIALLDKAVSFRPMGGGENVPVETVFLLLLDKTEHQVKMLGNIVSFIQDEANIRRLHCKEAAKSSLASFERFFAPEKAGDIA